MDPIRLPHGVYIYQPASDCTLVSLYRPVGPGRPPTTLSFTVDQLHSFAQYLADNKLAYSSGGRVVFTGPQGQIYVGHSKDDVRWQLAKRFRFGYQSVDVPLPWYPPTDVKAGVATNERVIEAFAGQHHGAFTSMSLSAHDNLGAMHADLPDLPAVLPWPVVHEGALVSASHEILGPSPPPEPSRDYPLLRAFAKDYPLNERAHELYLSWLFGCFHADYANAPIPLLVIDSWDRGMGKTELGTAFANILHGRASSQLEPPAQLSGGDALASSLAAGNRILVLDNLDGARTYNNAWLASLLTARNPEERVRYEATNRTFAGCAAILTTVYGSSTLSSDLMARTWRVSLDGLPHDVWSGGGPEPPVEKYALDNRYGLVAECYWAVRRSLDQIPPAPVRTRMHVFARHAFAAYHEVFKRWPNANVLPDAAALSGTAYHMLKQAKVDHYFNSYVSKADIPPQSLVGGTALGGEFYKDDKNRVQWRKP